jgi:hypothetical protein
MGTVTILLSLFPTFSSLPHSPRGAERSYPHLKTSSHELPDTVGVAEAVNFISIFQLRAGVITAGLRIFAAAISAENIGIYQQKHSSGDSNNHKYEKEHFHFIILPLTPLKAPDRDVDYFYLN